MCADNKEHKKQEEIKAAIKYCIEPKNHDTTWWVDENIFDGIFDIRYYSQTNEIQALQYDSLHRISRIFASFTLDLSCINVYAKTKIENEIAQRIIDVLRERNKDENM